ncbi:MAG: gamma-glutamylcyclotransferase [Actinobacteria bacterium]|nr:gamma-glutamylcyclotransferase [Actinomycetota bacterium]
MKYFAYGSNMDPVRMSFRCKGARAVGTAILPDHRLTFRRWRTWRTGLADVEPAPGERVVGVLWEIDERHERRLDRYEAVDRDLYRKERARVIAAGGHEFDVMIYVATLTGPKRPSKRYLRLLIRGAERNGLPPEYVETLHASRG